MIQKLRKQFILVAMCSTMAVLLIIIGSLNIANYWSRIQQTDEILSILSSNNGKFPDMFGQKRMDRDEEPPQPPKGGKKLGMMEFGPNGLYRFSREIAYETRFFSVTLDENGETQDLDLGMIAAIEEDTAKEYAAYVLKQYQKSGKTKGFLDGYRYLVIQNDSTCQIIFVDCATDLQEIKKVVIYSFSTSALGLLAVFFLVLFFSKKVFLPVEESYRKQRQFITDASHELKTPLTIISANVEVMEMESEESKWSRSIKKQIDRMVGLVEQMVTLSRMDEQNDLEKEIFSMSDAVKDTADFYYPVAESSGKELDVDIADGISYQGNEKQIRQMVGLILDNCMKYAAVPGSEDGSNQEIQEQHPRIRLTLKQKGKKIELIVWNTVSEIGVGDQNILFERFYRLDRSRNSEKGGSGIGLSIVKSIVEAHKGKISAYSKDGKSIEFKAIF